MRRVILALCAALAFSSCSDASPPDYDFSAFDAEVEAILVDRGLSGARTVVVHRDWGVLHTAAYGDHTLDRVSLLASSSKMLSAGVIMHLHDLGLLDVDAPIRDYAPTWWNRTRPMDFTLAQALSNSSGLVGLTDSALYGEYICQYSYLGSLQSCGGLIYDADDSADVSAPDTRFRYGGGQWQVAGAIAEVVSGMSWDELLEETYRTPCGLDVLGYGNQYQEVFLEQGQGNVTSYPTFVNGSADDIRRTNNPNIEGGGFTTIGDYGEILLMHLRGGRCRNGRALSRESVERMQEDRILAEYDGTTFQTGLGYGLGWWVDRGNPGVISDGGAYGAMPWLDLGRGYGAMLIVEDEGSTGSMAQSRLRPILEAIFDGD